jgi:crotonobetainyl-CoA:carnitine CoA-transferase CaiB-like acyl-CoA transferase
MTATALGGLAVLDASASVAGQFCGRMLADYGAAVTLSEPPEGSPTRRMGPFGREGSHLFAHLNHGKRIVQAPAESLAAAADITITDNPALAASIRTAHPASIVGLVTPFGADGPLSGWRGGEIIYQALSGMMANNGDHGRPPLYGVGHRASYSAGVVAYIGLLAAVLAKRRHGEGQLVSIDIAETAASMCFPYVMQYRYNGTVRNRNDQRQPVCPVQCRDGWVCIWVYPHLCAKACDVLGASALMDDARFATNPARQANWPAFIAAMNAHLAGREAEPLVALLQENGIIAARVYAPTDLLASAHLKARGYWDTIGTRPRLGPQFRFSATPRRAG